MQLCHDDMSCVLMWRLDMTWEIAFKFSVTILGREEVFNRLSNLLPLELQQELEQGRRVLIHCRIQRGRGTGTRGSPAPQVKFVSFSGSFQGKKLATFGVGAPLPPSIRHCDWQ